jgi:hypothetical protein
LKSETIRDTGELLNCTRRSPNDFKCYRGQCDASWSLIPSFYRGLDEFQPPSTDLEGGEWLGAVERDIYREFELKGRRFASREWEFHNPWHRLIFAQHYGLPTRLLDWSKSALIAAYFAVNSHPDQDGALWCINVSAMPFPSALGRRMKTAGFRLAQLDACVTRDRLSFLWPVSFKIVEETASPAAQAIASDQNGDSERDGFLLVIEPPVLEGRLHSQKSVFTTYIDYDESRLIWDHRRYIEQIEQHHTSEILTKFVIPRAAKELIRRDLETNQINVGEVFPDLPGLVERLKREREDSFRYSKEAKLLALTASV